MCLGFRVGLGKGSSAVFRGSVGLFRVVYICLGSGSLSFVQGSVGLFRVVYICLVFGAVYVCFGVQQGCFGLFVVVEGSGWLKFVYGSGLFLVFGLFRVLGSFSIVEGFSGVVSGCLQ